MRYNESITTATTPTETAPTAEVPTASSRVSSPPSERIHGAPKGKPAVGKT